jgi:hypothetical protein
VEGPSLGAAEACERSMIDKTQRVLELEAKKAIRRVEDLGASEEISNLNLISAITALLTVA